MSDNVTTGNIKRDFACKCALPNVTKLYNRYIDSGWEFNNKDYGHIGDELKNFVERILGKKLKLLNMPLSAESLEKAENIEINYDMETRKFY